MKVTLAGPYPQGTKAKFQALLPDHNIVEAVNQAEYDAVTDSDIIIVRVLKTTAVTMANKAALKLIIRWGAGFDSVDIQAAEQRGILVATTPGANAYAVSELAVALMLTAGRKVIEQNKLTHDGIWDNKQYADQMTTLNKKIVGLIGGGNIGCNTARQVQAFGATVIYYDEHRLDCALEAEYQMEYREIEEVIRQADVISLHIPLTDSSRHLIGAKQFAAMKPGVMIINTARGGLIDDSALADALTSGKVLAAGLDCVEDEDMLHNPLARMDNVIITPHMGGTTNDLPDEMVPRIAEQIERFQLTGTVDHLVRLADQK